MSEGATGRRGILAIIRRLYGITYWVLENAAEISDYVNVNLRKEWEGMREAKERKVNGC